MQNPFTGNSEEARESFKQVKSVEELETFQKRLSDGKEFEVMVGDNIFWFYGFNKLVLAQSNVLPFNPLCCKILVIAFSNYPLTTFFQKFRQTHCCFIVPFTRLNTCTVLVEKPYEIMSKIC